MQKETLVLLGRMVPSCSFHPVCVQFLVILVVLSEVGESRKMAEVKSKVGTILVFGDSLVDSGNNNHIPTIFKSNFSPYGQDFPNRIPTGRFCNGYLFIDFFGSYMGIKDSIPPYLEPNLSPEDLKTGVSFASANSGFDPLTAIMAGVISMAKQLENFKEYVSRMERYIGKEETKDLINNAIFFICCGSNDIAINYFALGVPRRATYNISGYMNFMLDEAQKFLQGVVEMGARKIIYAGVLPLGCVPAAITVYPDGFIDRRCVEWLSSVARDYNLLLQDKLTDWQSRLGPEIAISYADLYTQLDDMIKMPQQFGFEVVDRGCCGTGLAEVGVLCSSVSPVCSDTSKYVFWDSAHPSQAANYYMFLALRGLADQFRVN